MMMMMMQMTVDDDNIYDATAQLHILSSPLGQIHHNVVVLI